MRVYYKSTIDSRTSSPTNNYFQNAIVGEGLLYQIKADSAYADARQQLKNWGDFLEANQTEYIWGRDIVQCCWFLCGLSTLIDLYPAETKFKVLGDSIWNYFMVNLATAAAGLSRRQKFYNETYRGPIHYTKHLVLDPNYLSSYPDYANMTAAVQGRPQMAERDVEIYASPNPFKSRVVITIGKELQVTSYKLSIFGINGKQLETCNSKLATRNSFSWNASGLPAGVYIVKLKAGAKTYTKRLTLLR
jgi:hypothetical protein